MASSWCVYVKVERNQKPIPSSQISCWIILKINIFFFQTNRVFLHFCNSTKQLIFSILNIVPNRLNNRPPFPFPSLPFLPSSFHSCFLSFTEAKRNIGSIWTQSVLFFSPVDKSQRGGNCKIPILFAFQEWHTSSNIILTALNRKFNHLGYNLSVT